MSNHTETTGVLIVGHGTRDEVGTRQFLDLAESLKERLAPLAVEAAFLELREPRIKVGVERLLARGVSRLATVPLLLFAAGHIKRDIPREVMSALVARGRGDLECVQAGHLGCHAAIVELSQKRMREAESFETTVESGSSTCLLLVARGSKDVEAAEEMQRFATLRQDQDSSMRVEVAFLAMARPNLEEQLAKAVAGGFRRVIVQPHFLFEGELVERIRGQIEEMARKHPEISWNIVPPLADRPGKLGLASKLLANVILDRLREAGIRVVVSTGDD